MSQFIEMFGEEQKISLGKICLIQKGATITRNEVTIGSIPVVAGGQEPSCYHNEANRNANMITISASGAYAGYVNYWEIPIFASDCNTISPKDTKQLDIIFLYNGLKAMQKEIYSLQKGGAQPHVYGKDLHNLLFPFPPFEHQQEFSDIVKQADKSKFIGFKSQFIEMIKNTTSQRKKIHEIAKVQTGSTPSKNRQEYWYNGNHPWVSAQDMIDKYVEDTIEKVTNAGYATCKVIPAGSVLYVCRGSIGVISINKMDCATNQSICTATCLNNCRNEFLYYSLKYSEKDIKQQGTGTSFKSLNQSSFSSIEIDVPSLDKQNTFIEIAQQADKSKYIN